MSDKIRLELKVGKAPEENEDDVREIFSGIIDKTAGSTLTDDKWSKRLPGQRQENLYFALYVSPGNVQEILQEVYDYNQSVKAAKTSAILPLTEFITPTDFINDLRSRYINRMPDIAEGKIIYGIELKEKRLQFRCSKDVTHRQRIEC